MTKRDMDDHMQRAREMLAAEYGRDGRTQMAASCMSGAFDQLPEMKAIAAALRSQAAQAVPEGWQKLAANWLERRAVEQEATNAKYPRHAAAYKEWRDRPAILRMLAQQVVSADDPVTGVKQNCPPPSWMFPEDERAAAPKPEQAP